MSTAIIDQQSVTQRRPTPAVKPARRRAPVRGPLARPRRSALIPPRPMAVDLAGSSGVALPYATTVWACRADSVNRRSSSWRLTDRGIALVLALAAILVVAAVTVIGLTAWQVTSPGYQTMGVSELSPR
jgi:hypothetical protein